MIPFISPSKIDGVRQDISPGVVVGDVIGGGKSPEHIHHDGEALDVLGRIIGAVCLNMHSCLPRGLNLTRPRRLLELDP
jgi:hypothetical protein